MLSRCAQPAWNLSDDVVCKAMSAVRVMLYVWMLVAQRMQLCWRPGQLLASPPAFGVAVHYVWAAVVLCSTNLRLCHNILHLATAGPSCAVQ
jgi:hypothetical protein